VNNSLWIIFGGFNMLIIVMILLTVGTFFIMPEVIAAVFGAFSISYVLGYLFVPTFTSEWAFWITMGVLTVLATVKGFYNIKYNHIVRMVTTNIESKVEVKDDNS